MRCPRIAELPPPPAGKVGWPWTEESPSLSATDGSVERPRVSVVVPSFQQGRFIEETLRSVLLQGYPDLELIVMDGGSKDETVSILRKYERWIACWRSEKDGGQSAAVNEGWRRASGQLLSWLNSDDLVMPGWLGRAVPPMMADPAIDCTFSDVQVIDENGRPLSLYPGQDPTLENMVVFWKTPFAHMGFLARARVPQTYGYLREDLHFAMDVEFMIRILDRGARFARVEGINGAFRIHGSGKTSTHQEIHVSDLIDLTRAYCANAGPERAELAERARKRLHWNAAHIHYNNHEHSDALKSAVRHLADHGWTAAPRVAGMVGLSLLGERGHQILSRWRQLKASI